MPRKSSRRKKKKLKFLSLRLNLSPETPTAAAEEDTIAADFFAAAVDGCAAATLAALFGVESPSAQDSGTPSPSLTHAPYEAQDSGAPSPPLRCARDHIFRTAMRGSEGREREERWVCYEEVTSCDAGVGVVKVHPQGLSLKLDYQEIIDAWCDKGPLYMPGPQTVPDLADHDLLSFGASNGLSDGYISNAAMWTVPENNVREEPEESLKIRHREASVLRYKEKRRNRLFSKRIRYEVRKINAEKRPRMKGRFVKRI